MSNKLIRFGLATFLVASSVVGRGQSQKSDIRHLRDLLKSIDHWSEVHISTDTLSSYDTLQKVNDEFQSSLKRFASRYPSSISLPLKELQDRGLLIATSPDSLFRIYSWDTYTGGTMHIFANVFQFKSDGKVFSKAKEHYDEGDGASSYSNIYLLKTPTTLYYLAIGNSILSTLYLGQQVNAFTITGKKLVAAKIFKTTNGFTNSIEVDYSLPSLPQSGKDSDDLFIFDPDKKTISFPVVREDGTVTNRKIVYAFDGQYFVKEKY